MLKALLALALVSAPICQAQTEVGIAAGSPALANLTVGFLSDAQPFLVRAFGGFSGVAGGAGGEVGYLVDREGVWHHYVGVGAEAGAGEMGLFSYKAITAGPRYGMRYRGWNFSMGAHVGTGEMQDRLTPALLFPILAPLMILSGERYPTSFTYRGLFAMPSLHVGYGWTL